MKPTLFITFVFLQTIIIAALVIRIRQGRVLGAVSVIPISGTDIVSSPEARLKYFYEPKPNRVIDASERGLPSTAKYTINADSLNERFDYETDKPDNIFRLITLGDSFTVGQFVDTKDNFSEQLEDLLNQNSACASTTKFEVINLGVSGYDIEYSLQRFIKRGKKYHPDLVLWLLINNDFDEIHEMLLPKLTKHKQKFEEVEIERSIANGNFRPWSKLAKEDLQRELGKEAILAHQLTALKSISNHYTGKLVLTTFPFVRDEYKKAVRDAIAHLPNSYLYPNLPDIYRLGARTTDSHPDVRGHTLIAQNLFEHLTASKLIPCNQL